MTDRTRRGWTPAKLERLGVVHRGGPMFELPNREKLYDDGRKEKVIAASGKPRKIWPDPEDQPGDVVFVVEGRADAITAAELGYPVVSVPNAGYRFKAGEAERIMARRHRVYVIADCDEPGRKGARRWAHDLAEHGAAFLVDLAPEKDDGWDLGDVFANALRIDPAGAVDLARYFIDARLEKADHVFAASDDDTPLPDASSREHDPASGCAPWPAPLHDDAFHGIAGDFVRTIEPHSEADPRRPLDPSPGRVRQRRRARFRMAGRGRFPRDQRKRRDRRRHGGRPQRRVVRARAATTRPR